MAMKWKPESALVVAVLLIGTAAFAQELNLPATGPSGSGPSELSGIELGVRVGYGLPLGTAYGVAGLPNTKLSDLISGMIPFWADVGYRIDPNWYVGGFFQFGLGFVPSSLCPGISCSENDLRFGLDVHYHFLPAGTFDPWVGIGAGYEIFNLSASSSGVSGSASTNGWEFGNAQLGLDFKLSPEVGVGPFVTFTVAQFANASASVQGISVSQSIANKTIHEWLIFGLRGVFDLTLD